MGQKVITLKNLEVKIYHIVRDRSRVKSEEGPKQRKKKEGTGIKKYNIYIQPKLVLLLTIIVVVYIIYYTQQQ
jgi:hypothetical protein